MILKSVSAFFSVQLIALYIVHKLTFRGEIEYSFIVNILLIGVLSFFWPRYLDSTLKNVLEKKQFLFLFFLSFVGISIAFVVDYLIWLLSVELYLRNIEWKDGLAIVALYFAVSSVILVVLFCINYVIISRRV